MGMLVRLLGSGIGLASEALHNRKLNKAESKQQTQTQGTLGESSSRNSSSPRQVSCDDPPPEYVEVSEDTGRAMIADGRAMPASETYGYDKREPLSVEYGTSSIYPDEKAGRGPYASTYPDEKAHDEDGDEDEDDSSTEEKEGDEEAWELDEASRELTETPSEEPNAPVDMKKLSDTFIRNHPPPPFTAARLPCPVILPQRRPRDKKRGFVRAYAPVLQECGIDQATFLEFLKAFHTSCQADKWLSVVNLAAGIVGFVPGPIVMGVSIAVQVAVGVAMEVQRLSRSNSFLDQMNNEFFKPRGLYCLIMTYKPDSTAPHETVDITSTISKYSVPAASSTSRMMQNLRVSSGKTYGDFELPEAAPLVFPTLERLAVDSSADGQNKQKEVSSGSNKKFVADYFDRRAQAKYAAETQGGRLATMGAQPVFHSRYADPNHAASSGSLLSLITGGDVNPRERKLDRRERKSERREERWERKSERREMKAWRKEGDGREDMRERKAERREERWERKTERKERWMEGKGQRRKGGLVKRVLQKDVLYLMVVNLPTEEEMRMGRDAVANEGRQYRY